MARRPPGTGTVTRTESGTYRARIRDGAGRRIDLGTYATEAEAHAARVAALRELVARQIPATGVVTLRAWGESWLSTREARGVAKERSVWRRHIVPHLGALALHEVTRTAVTRWLDALRTTPATKARAGGTRGSVEAAGRVLSTVTVKHALRLLRAALEAAVDAGKLPTNPAREAKPPKPRARVDDPWTFLSADEVRALEQCTAIPDPERAIYVVAIYTGLRKGELWGLRPDDVTLDGDRPEVVVRRSNAGPTKSGKVRRVPLLPQAVEALRRVLVAGARWVFPGEHGQRREDDDARWAPDHRLVTRVDGTARRADINGYRKRAGIERRVRFHDLRHTCASHLLMGTWGVRLSIEEVSAWLGHSSTAVTQRYAHLAPDHLSARVGAALRGPTGSPSAGSAVSSPNAQKPLENTGRAMQESNLRLSASETDAPRAKTPCPPTNRTPADPPRTHDRVAVAVLEVAARGEPLPRGLVAELARAALACGVASADVARMWVAGPTQARAVVEVAVMVAATVADEAARAAGE